LIPGASWADLIKVKTGFYSSNPRYKGFFHGLELYFIRDSPFGFELYFIEDSVDRKFTSYRILSLLWSKPKVKTQFHRMKLDLRGLLSRILLSSRPGFTALTQETKSSFHGLELYFIRDSPFGFTFYFIGDSVDRKFTSYRDSQPFLVETQSQNPVSLHET
jgi:hypothetical protein